MLCDMRLPSDIFKPIESIPIESSRDARELMRYAQRSEPLAGQSEAANVGCPVSRWRRWWLEALLRQIGSLVDPDELVRIGSDSVEDLSNELIGEVLNDGSRGHEVGDRRGLLKIEDSAEPERHDKTSA